MLGSSAGLGWWFGRHRATFLLGTVLLLPAVWLLLLVLLRVLCCGFLWLSLDVAEPMLMTVLIGGDWLGELYPPVLHMVAGGC